MSKVCIISTHAPYGSSAVRDAIEAILVAASYDMEATLLVLGDGVLQLLRDQNPTALPQKNTGAMLQAMDMYGIENVLVCEEDLQERGLTKQDLLLSPIIISHEDIPILLQKQDRILNF